MGRLTNEKISDWIEYLSPVETDTEGELLAAFLELRDRRAADLNETEPNGYWYNDEYIGDDLKEVANNLCICDRDEGEVIKLTPLHVFPETEYIVKGGRLEKKT